MTRYFIRVQAPSEPADAYATRGPDGLPTWTWQQPEPLTLEDAEALMRDTARSCGGSLLLELAEADES